MTGVTQSGRATANISAVLLDLDDTLLDNDIHSFLPPYFALLGEYARPYMEPERFLEELLWCTRFMASSQDGSILLRDRFWSCFQERSGLEPAELEPFFDRFYQGEFSQLATLTRVRPSAQRLVSSCLENGLKLVIATNPMFPRVAIEKRLEWAGLSVTDFAFDLVTSYDNMHATKPWLAYYSEILDKIDCRPEEALMVGDSWENDIVPAAKIGMCTFWISQGTSPPDETMLSGSGTMPELLRQLLNGWFDEIPLPEFTQVA